MLFCLSFLCVTYLELMSRDTLLLYLSFETGSLKSVNYATFLEN